MRRAALLSLLVPALLAGLAPRPRTVTLGDSSQLVRLDDQNRTVVLDRGRVVLDSAVDADDTLVEFEGGDEPVVRRKRTFGDIVFRGLADVLGYQVARKAPQVVFPPPVAPVPGIDSPLLVLPAGSALALPLATQAAPAAAAAPAPAPCAAARATAPCAPPRPPPPPAPKAAPPCSRPRAAPKPRPKPNPPPPPPCPQPRANPPAKSPCAPAPPPPKRDDPNLERITSNFQLNFNFNREPANQAAAAQEEAEAEADQPADEPEQPAPIPIRPQAARLPPEEPRKPRVYVDAFVLNDGVPHRVDTVDARRLVPHRGAVADDDEFLAYDEDDDRQDVENYDDVQESRNQDKTIQEFGNVIDRFWEKKKMMKRTMKVPKDAPLTHYRDVHFGDRDLDNDIRLRGETHQSLQRAGPHPNRIPIPIPNQDDEDEDTEATTTTEDPRNPLRPRVLPPTEQNPNQIDTITVRVPPIYREKRPRKLHRENYYPERDEDERDERDDAAEYRRASGEDDAEGYGSLYAPVAEPPRRRRRKPRRRTRAAPDDYRTDDEFDYFGKKVPVTDEEKYFMGLTVPPPTRDADILRHEKPVASGYFLEDHERLRDDPSQRLRDDPSHRLHDDPSHELRDDPSDKISDERERSDSAERSGQKEREGDKERLREAPEQADERERSDKLGPNARVTESNYENKFVRATNVQVDDPRPKPARKAGKA